MNPQDLAREFIQGLPQDILDNHVLSNEDTNWGQGPTFTNTAVDCIASEMQYFIACVIASLIDAGSEREAIMEDEQLSLTLRATLKDW